MSDDIKWGPWVDHEGGGCPLPSGTYVQLGLGADAKRCPPHKRLVNPRTSEGFIVASEIHSGPWTRRGTEKRIVRYRVRKPRGLVILEQLLVDLPAPVGPEVDA